MKKKFLLAAIPVLMVLASCTYMQSATKAQLNQNFLKEDTVAHEEIFDGAELQLINNSNKAEGPQPLRAPADITEPIIGVQYVTGTKQHRGENKPVISFRYVAVIQSKHVKAEWIRAVSSQSGGELKAKAVKESTVAYTAISNGSTYITAEDMGGSCFVVYTLYDIPLFEHNEDGIFNCNWSYIAAGLKLTDLDDPEESTMSKIVAVEIGNRNHFSFYESALADERGYFAAGIIEDSGTAENQRVVPLPKDGDDNHAKKTFEFAPEDHFGVFKWSSTEFKFLGSFNNRYETFYTGQSEELSSNYAKLYCAGTYTLFVNNSDQYGLGADHLYDDLYLNATSWGYGDARYALYAFGGSGGEEWFDFESTGEAGHYQIEDFDVAAYPSFNLCRMNGNSGHEANNWDNRWNQTGNISYRDTYATILDVKNTFSVWFEGGDHNNSYSRS